MTIQNKTAILVLTHKPMPYLKLLAQTNKHINFYIHIDKKINSNHIVGDFNDLDNVIFIKDRIIIHWAGFSMIQATLNLIKVALLNKENQFFHLISADDVLLQKIEDMNNAWQHNNPEAIYLDSKISLPHRYRLRFNAPHADTIYQRHPIGKSLTLAFKLMDKIIPAGPSIPNLFGSQWFSIRRSQLHTLIDSITKKDYAFFSKKLCPDEHFFQYIIARTPELYCNLATGNQRYIIFDPSYNRGSNPIFLSLDQLKKAQDQGAWFARKVDATLAKEALSLIYKE
ncbi:beta-1,6-N-acetylglucosaminyltransferase [Neisseriaceae bacterium CLB008]